MGRENRSLQGEGGGDGVGEKTDRLSVKRRRGALIEGKYIDGGSILSGKKLKGSNKE